MIRLLLAMPSWLYVSVETKFTASSSFIYVGIQRDLKIYFNPLYIYIYIHIKECVQKKRVGERTCGSFRFGKCATHHIHVIRTWKMRTMGSYYLSLKKITIP